MSNGSSLLFAATESLPCGKETIKEAFSPTPPPLPPPVEDKGSREREGVEPKSSIFRYSVVALADVGSSTEARGSPVHLRKFK